MKTLLRENEIKRAGFLQNVLNHEEVRELAFGRRILWDFLAGCKNYGALLYEITIACIPAANGEFKLKVWLDQSQQWGYYQNQYLLAWRTGLSLPTVNRGLERLRDRGFINWEVRHDQKGAPTRYFYIDVDVIFENIALLLYRGLKPLHSTIRSLRSNDIYILNIIKRVFNIEQDPNPGDRRWGYVDHFSAPDRERDPENKTPNTEKDPEPDPEAEPERTALQKEQDLIADLETLIHSNQDEQATKSTRGKSSADVEEKVNKQNNKKAIALVGVKAIARSYYLLSEAIKSYFEERIKRTVANKLPIMKFERKTLRAARKQGDKFFNNQKQTSKERNREMGKTFSNLGFSAFKDLQQLGDCQLALTKYFLKNNPLEKAEEKAYWKIVAETQGKRSLLVDDFLKGLEIGSSNQQEWEQEPGMVRPVFLSYLKKNLHLDGNTDTQDNRAVEFSLQNLVRTRADWKECKRQIKEWESKIAKAHEQGRDLRYLDIPDWYINAFQRELTIEEVTPTAQALANIATDYCKGREEAQSTLLPLDTKKILDGVRNANKDAQIEPEQLSLLDEGDKIPKESVIDQLPEKVQDVLKGMDGRRIDARPRTVEEEVDHYLDNSLTRGRGVRMARDHRLPLLHDENGTAIAVDWETIHEKQHREEINRQVESPINPALDTRENESAYKIYKEGKPQGNDEFKNNTSFDWEAARARLRKNTGKKF